MTRTGETVTSDDLDGGEQTEFWKEFWIDFIAAQREMRHVPFDLKNPHFGNEYASLAACRDAIYPVFHRHGFAVVQEINSGARGPVISIGLAHKSGEYRHFGSVEFPSSKQDSQGWAGAITYGRRYTLLTLAGVTGDHDDDGEAASAKPVTLKISDTNTKSKGK